MKHKIGLLTFQYAHNYGAILQAYALKQFLESQNKTVEIINYANIQAMDMYAYKPKHINSIIPWLRSVKNMIFRTEQYIKFLDFSKEYLEVNMNHCFDNIHLINGKYEIIIVGSDQVWNSTITHGDLSYMLKDVICSTKVAYAASLGKIDESIPLTQDAIHCLNEFKHISVREKDGVKYLQQYLSVEIEQSIDPVFLLNKTDWEKIAFKNHKTMIKGKYILLFTLMQDKELIQKCDSLCRSLGIEVYTIHPMCWKQPYGKQLYNVGPKEFVSLIANAEYVITNSFHAVVFSIIFDRKIVTKTIERGNSRIDNLLDLVGCKYQDGVNELDLSLYGKEELCNSIISSKKYIRSIT